MAKIRLDVLLTEKGLCESREKSKAVIMAGQVYINNQKVDKAGTMVSADAEPEIRGNTLEYVSRGGLKLEKAIKSFHVSANGKICIDCGASTGGFSDVLLKNGAEKVYAIDVGYGQLAWSIRNNPKVVVMERTNIRNVTTEQVPDKPTLAAIDVSFISLRLVLPVLKDIMSNTAEVCCLVKPQFEAGRDYVGKKGVVRELSTHITVLENFVKNANDAGFGVVEMTFSPVKGPEGNIEYLAHLIAGVENGSINPTEIAEQSHRELG